MLGLFFESGLVNILSFACRGNVYLNEVSTVTCYCLPLLLNAWQLLYKSY